VSDIYLAIDLIAVIATNHVLLNFLKIFSRLSLSPTECYCYRADFFDPFSNFFSMIYFKFHITGSNSISFTLFLSFVLIKHFVNGVALMQFLISVAH